MFIKKKKHFPGSFRVLVKSVDTSSMRDLFVKGTLLHENKKTKCVRKCERKEAKTGGVSSLHSLFPRSCSGFFFYYLFLSVVCRVKPRFERKINPLADLRERATTYRTEY